MKKLFVVMTLAFSLMGGSAFATSYKMEYAKDPYKVIVNGEILSSQPLKGVYRYGLLVKYKKELYTCSIDMEWSDDRGVILCSVAKDK